MFNKKVAAIVVTYNRANLLIRCLDNILNQELKPDIVYIIDNNSTDNTYDMLKDNKYINNTNNSIKFKYYKLEKNSGGAGGFYEGLKYAFEDKYDLFWLMDDDGIPDKQCLKELIKYTDEYQFISPLVLSDEDSKVLSFGIHGILEKDVLLSKYKEKIENVANPFNGVLFTRDMVCKIGFPKKDMFIWGDENEYQQRALKHGFKVVTILQAIHYHPKNRIKQIDILFGKSKVNFPDGELRQYCLFRNYAFIFFNYYPRKRFIKWFIKYIYLFIISKKLDLKGLIFFLKSTKDGLNNNFNNHHKYI